MRPVRAPLLDRADLPTASKTDTAAYLHDYFTSRLEKSELHNPPAAPPIDDYLVVGADTGGTPSVNISKVGLPQVPKGKPSEMLLLDEVSLPEEVFDHVQNLAAEIEKTKVEQARLDKEQEDLREKIAIKNDERKRLVMDMDDALLKRYARIRESKGGLAVTTVNSGACGGCFRRIPPHEMQNLKKDDYIITCEGCGRILIWKWE